MAKRSPPGAPARKRAAKRGKRAEVNIKRQIGACSSPPRLVAVAAVAAVAAAASSSGSNSYNLRSISASSPIDDELHRSTAESVRSPRSLAVSNAPGDDRPLPSRCCLSNCSGEEDNLSSTAAAFLPPASVHDPATPSSAEDADDQRPAPAEASPPADDLKPTSCRIRRHLLPKMFTICNLLRGCRLLFSKSLLKIHSSVHN